MLRRRRSPQVDPKLPEGLEGIEAAILPCKRGRLPAEGLGQSGRNCSYTRFSIAFWPSPPRWAMARASATETRKGCGAMNIATISDFMNQSCLECICGK